MKKLNKFFCIPFIIACIISILFMYNISCSTDILEINIQLYILSMLSFIIILIGIFTDCTYIIRDKLTKKAKK